MASKYSPIIAATGVAFAASAAFAQPANLVVNPGFETPVVSQPWVQRLPGVTFDGWTVDNVGQGIVHVGSFGRPSAAEGLQCLELNFYQACGVSQTIPTVAGTSYLLSFLMAGQADAGPNVKHMRIDWNGSPIDTATWDRSASGGNWQSHGYTVTAAGPSSVLHFFGLENVDGGPYLDAVRLIPICGSADIGSTGGVHLPDGVLDNNDFIVFIDVFFAADPAAEIGVQGGVPGSDGQFDNNDFIVYIDRFFNGC